jgi:hypothetical protein
MLSVMFITHHLFCFWKSIIVRDDLNELISRQLSFAIFFSKKEIKDPSSTLPFNTKTPAEKPEVVYINDDFLSTFSSLGIRTSPKS